MAGEINLPILIALLLGMSAVVGALISTIVFIGDLERMPILRALDKLPGLVAAVLTGLCCFATFHLLHGILEGSRLFEGLFLILSVLVSVTVGYRVHRHRLAHATNYNEHHHINIKRRI
jgi:uncharacterized membrane protein YgaE (UPF0421/DUF939 family)